MPRADPIARADPFWQRLLIRMLHARADPIAMADPIADALLMTPLLTPLLLPGLINITSHPALTGQ